MSSRSADMSSGVIGSMRQVFSTVADGVPVQRPTVIAGSFHPGRCASTE